ncbi:receptor-type tyrosine-protein phosphatase eta isoform X2 [Stegastes partitus]|uniref:protein-tyrosine-phosphatase n=1 Tax=Stegastes partitus TaxID=144197 RepID=A0A9Y4TTD5_9TELE|nr:PREDICTED: receptor-type tyrosine-protein phosphatase eta isoform X2 [Stegastes partitus]
MKLRSGVSLWTLLVFCALLKNARAQCDSNCSAESTLKTTERTVTLESQPSCHLSTGDLSGNGSITGLTPGAVYEIHINCSNCCKEVTTKPEKVGKLNVADLTTSSIFVNWTKPDGNSSFYKVRWTNGTETKNESTATTSINITNLTPGVQYNITVTAVADDHVTKGASATVSQYTKPGQIENLNVSTTTTSISLTWSAPPGQVSDYKVEWVHGGTPMTRFTSNNPSAVLSDLTPGTRYTITVTAVAGDNETQGEPVTNTSITKPAAVVNLNVAEVTTSTVSLNWTEPEGKADRYKILWSSGGDTFNTTTTNETFYTISDLSPGFQYNITVAAVAGEPSVEGEGTSRTTFTRPEKPESITATEGTDNLIIRWTLPRGRAVHYVVNISNTNLMYSNSTQTEDQTARFTGLYPGRLFDITVTAVAGNFQNTSETSSFATAPTPPGHIVIDQPTNSSLRVAWTTPSMMEGAPDISYRVTYQPGDGELHTEVREVELSPLASGTSYNVTVETVGPQNLNSTIVHKSAFTRPNPVLNLEARPKSTASVTVSWTDPLGVQPYYQYLVETYNDTGMLVDSKTVNESSTDVTGLEPGSKYDINVTTVAAPGSKSDVEQTFSYTIPKAVTNLTAEHVNTTAIRLTWLDDHESSTYQVVVFLDDLVVRNISTAAKTYTFGDLEPGNEYIFNVCAVVAGVKSTVVSTSSYTVPSAVSNLTAIGNTTSLSVSWTPGSGNVSSYSVLLYRDSLLITSATDLSAETRDRVFTDLKPGVLYLVKVIAKSGRLENPANVSNATFPNPPGPITVVSQTVKSINFTWPLPEDMDHNQYNFRVSSSANVSALIQNNSFLLDDLSSGSLHNISVVTVGVWNYSSTAVTAATYTRPFSVTNLSETEITTNTVRLAWEQPEIRSNYTYLVQVSNGSSDVFSKVESTNTSTVTPLVSGSNFSFTVTTRAADGTEADPVTVSYFTRPYGVRGLVAETLNTEAINLAWMRPLEYRTDYRYRIETTGCGSSTITLTEETAVISELTPGTNCTFCVSVMAANDITGEENCTSQYTRPEMGHPSISSWGSNSSVLVNWTQPRGNVEYYKVHLNDSLQSVQLSSTDTSHLFDDLSAGRFYSAVLITCSGPFNASSEVVTNATFPNPPGPIQILAQTTSSIEFRWGDAPLMSGASFYYQVTNTPSQRGGNVTTNTTTGTSHTFASLPSGTSFNLSVVTVGVGGFESGRVYSEMVTTRPQSVQFLTTTSEETNITVSWTQPVGYKDSYRYNLTWEGSDGTKSSELIQETSFTIHPLDPGSRYNISVTTVTSDGTAGAPRLISTCTRASPVTDLTCKGPNNPNAEVILNWTKPRGQYSGFSININTDTIDRKGTCCSHTVSDLRHNTNYTLTVTTLSCGGSSYPVTISCKTGITNPPAPLCGSLMVVADVQHNRFSLNMNSNVLNDLNGPITDIGVLVTSNVPDNSSNLKQYLGKTYSEWRAETTPVYLATVVPNIAHQMNDQDFVVIGNGSQWKGYSNGVLDPKGRYQYAIAIFTSLKADGNLVDSSSSLVSITNFCSVTLDSDPAVIAIAIAVPLSIFCILFIILIGFIVYWRRIAKKDTSDIQIHSLRSKVSVAVRVEDYEAYYKKQKADSNCGFAEEFEDLKIVGTSQAKLHALSVENKPKNRYNNVLPYDSSRVKLSIIHGSPYDDYINANYMPGYISRKEFIAAQGPLPTTVNEFWRMIWEKNVQTMVMLTRCNEQGRVKCEQYWGSGTKHFENITVRTTSEIPLEDWTIRDFDVRNVKTAETRSIRHFHFTAWPDHGVPETTELLISFRHLVREHMNQYSRNSPTVVHCSAGVGRTGTLIAIDRLIFQIERENIVDVFGIVHDLRMHRPLMVQTEDQYVFLNQCALDIIRSRTGTNVDLIYQNTAALSIYENVEPKKGYSKNGYHNP